MDFGVLALINLHENNATVCGNQIISSTWANFIVDKQNFYPYFTIDICYTNICNNRNV